MRRASVALAAALALTVFVPVGASAADPVTWVFEATGDNQCGVGWQWYGAAYKLEYTFDPDAVPAETSLDLAIYPAMSAGLTVDGAAFNLDTVEVTIGNDEPGLGDSFRVTATSPLLLQLAMSGPSTIFDSTDLPAAPPNPSLFNSVVLEDDLCFVDLTGSLDMTHRVLGPIPPPQGAIETAIAAVLADLSGNCFDPRDDRLDSLGEALDRIEKAEAKESEGKTDAAVKETEKALKKAGKALEFTPEPTCLDLTTTLGNDPRTVLGGIGEELAGRPEADPKVQKHFDEALAKISEAFNAEWIDRNAVEAFKALNRAIGDLDKVVGNKQATASDELAAKDAINDLLKTERFLIEQMIIGGKESITADVEAQDIQSGDTGLAVLGSAYSDLVSATQRQDAGEYRKAAEDYRGILIDFTGAGIVIIGDPNGIVIIGDPAG